MISIKDEYVSNGSNGRFSPRIKYMSGDRKQLS